MKNDISEVFSLRWTMDDESWSHWAQGRGRQTVSEVVHAEVEKVRKGDAVRERIRKRCAGIEQSCVSGGVDAEDAHLHEVEVQLSAADWGEACQLVGEPGNPVKPRCMLAAVILESPSWEQSGSNGAEFNAGWVENRLVCSVTSSRNVGRTQTIRLGTVERIIAWVIAAGTVIGAAATLAMVLL